MVAVRVVRQGFRECLRMHRRARRPVRVAVAGALARCVLALAAIHGAAAQADDGRRSMVEQKLRLLDSVLASPRTTRVEQGDNADAKNLLAKARGLAAEARGAFAAGALDRAAASVDEAMRAASAAAARGAPAAAARSTPEEQQAQFQTLTRQVRQYRTAIAAVPAERAGPEAEPARARLDRLVTEAEELGRAGRLTDANRLLGEALKTAVGLLATWRRGETVVYQLKFDSPAQEFDYEAGRLRSYEMLVDLALAERAVPRDRLEPELAASRRYKAEAETQARHGRHSDGVKSLERATAHLVRALQSLGLPVSE
jgi:hypothetical protein